VNKPTAITDADALAKTIPDADWLDKIKKQVDFDKQQLIWFAWGGSGQDKLSHEVKDGEVIFEFQRGRTRDLRPHFHAFVIPKEAKWKVVEKKQQ
jgi:hypothetical protein